uniref:Uncharacterized protein n=1 Tax=Thermosporothrix sp. COM3 TaxID=2490863 RepID=A0A455SDN5_9CHLR|nr:hypothetical protein KTC_01720 [Thermosporothrix sp. COM3]
MDSRLHEPRSPYTLPAREIRVRLNGRLLRIWNGLILLGGIMIAALLMNLVSFILFQLYPLETLSAVAIEDTTRKIYFFTYFSSGLFIAVVLLINGWFLFAYYRFPVLKINEEGITLASPPFFRRTVVPWSYIECLSLQSGVFGPHLAIQMRYVQLYLSRIGGLKAWRMRRMLEKTGAPLRISQGSLARGYQLKDILQQIQHDFAEEVRMYSIQFRADH